MTKTYLHIGLPKTGTTTLQNYMLRNRDLLNDHGLNYPDMTELGAPKKANGHHFMAHQLAKSPDKIGEFREFLADQRQQNPNPIFLSAEPFARHGVLASLGSYDTWSDKKRYVERVHSAIGAEDTEVIITLRQPHILAESAYKELVKKTTYSKSFDAYVNTRFYGYDFEKLLALWHAFFRKITVQIFEQSIQHPEGVTGAMLRPICPSLPNIAPGRATNIGWHPKYTEFKRLLNAGPFDKNEMLEIRVALEKLAATGVAGQMPSLWSQQKLIEFQPRVLAGNKRIAKTFFNQNDDLFAPVDASSLTTFIALNQQDFANLLDGIAEAFPQKLVEKIVSYLARKMQNPQG